MLDWPCCRLTVLLVLSVAVPFPRSAPAEPPRVAPPLLERLRAASGGGMRQDVELAIRFRAGAREEVLHAAARPGEVLRILEGVRRIEARAPAEAVLPLALVPGVVWIDERPPPGIDRDELDGLRAALGITALSPLPEAMRGKWIKVAIWEAGHPDVESASGSFPR